MALAIILGWYFVLGILGALGAIALSRQGFSARVEPIVFGLLLAPIAAIYWAFAAYFGTTSNWGIESAAVCLFALLGIAGIRFPFLLILGYGLHGLWDLVHEAAALGGPAPAGAQAFTAIPLAYGAFCAAFDWWVAGYFYQRRAAWQAARRAPAA